MSYLSIISVLPTAAGRSTAVLKGYFRFTKGNNNTNRLIDQGSGKSAAPMFCGVKLLILPEESGGFSENDIWLILCFFSPPVSQSQKLIDTFGQNFMANSNIWLGAVVECLCD